MSFGKNKLFFITRTRGMRTVGGYIVAACLLIGGIVLNLGTGKVATAAPSAQLNFQARLLTSAGAPVPDGYYNIQFKLYDAAANGGGSLLWTESWIDTNGVTAGNDFRVRVTDGYLSVYLGTLTAFPALDWGSQLYITMNVGGTTQTATPTYDGEMLNAGTTRMQLTAVPYAFAAANVGSGDTNAASTDSSDVAITTGDALGATSNSGDILIDTGTATGTAGAINLGSTNASAITIGRSGITTTLQGSVSISGGTNYGVYYRDGSGNVVSTAAGTTNQCFRATTGAAPSWGSCSGTGDVIQDGNSFSATMTIGTNDAFNLQLETAGVTRLTLDQSGNATLTGDLTVQGGDITAGTTGTAGSLVISDGSSSTVTLKSASQVAATNYDLTIPAITGNDTLCLQTLNNCAGTASGWTDGGTVVALTTGTDDVTVGSTSNLGKLAVDGDSDEVQLLVQGNATQTSNILTVENSGGTDIFGVSASGATINTQGTSNVGLTIQTTASTNTGLRINAPNGYSAGNYFEATQTGVAYNLFEVDYQGRVKIRPTSDNSNIFSVMDAAGTNTIFSVDTSTGVISTSGSFSAASGLYADNLTLNTGSGVTYSTPGGASVSSKINIVNEAGGVGANNQVVAMGINSSSDSSARVLSLFDQRAGAHQPSLAVFSPDENDAIGFSWEGSNTTAYMKTLGDNIGIRINTTDIITMTSSAITFAQDATASGNLIANGNTTLGNAVTDNITVSGAIQGTNALIFDGSTDDTNETTLAVTNPTGDNTITLPDLSGTVALTSNNQTFANTQTFSGILSVTGNTTIGDANTDTLTIAAGSSGTGITFSDSSFQSCTLTTSAGGVLTCGSAATATTGWTDGGAVVALTTAGDKVTVGSTSSLAKLAVDGQADEIQLLVQGNGTQTSNLVVIENSAGTDLVTIDGSGVATFAGSASTSDNGAVSYVTGTLSGTGAINQQGLRVNPSIAPGSASTSTFYGIQGIPSSSSSNLSGAAIYGVAGMPAYSGTSTVNTMAGTYGQLYNLSSGTVTNGYGMYVANPINTGTITDNYGIYVAAQSAGASDYGVAIQAADTQTLWISQNANSTTAAGGIAFGSSRDTNLYRSAANTLATDDSLVVGTDLQVNGGDITTAAGDLTINPAGGDTAITGNLAVTGTTATNIRTTTDGTVTIAEYIGSTPRAWYGTTNAAHYIGFGVGGNANDDLRITTNHVLAVGDTGTISSANGNGDLYVEDLAEFDGSLLLGDATADTITFTGRVASTINPTTNDTYDLGSSTLIWNDVYVDRICFDGNTDCATTSAALNTSGFTDDGTVVRLTTSTDNVTIGSTTDLSAALAVDGNADEIQLLVQANATQTSTNLAVFETSGGTDLVTISGAGNTAIATTVADTSEAASLRVTSTATSITNEQNGIYSSLTASPASGTPARTYNAIEGQVQTSGATSANVNLWSIFGQATLTGSTANTGNIGGGNFYAQNQASVAAANMYGIMTSVQNISTGSITTAYGINVQNNTAGSGTIGTNYGVFVTAQTAGTSDYGVAIQAADTQTLWLSQNANNTTAAAGIAFGSSRDTNLYRSAANVLKTDDSFTSMGTITGGAAGQFVAGTSGIDYFGDSTSALRLGYQAGIPLLAFDTNVGAGTNGNLYLGSSGADSGTTTKDSSTIELSGSYYNGSTNYTSFKILNDITGTTSADYKLSVKNNSGTEVASITGAGAATFKNSSNSTAAFSIQNSSSQSLFAADTSNTALNMFSGTAGDISPWTTDTAITDGNAGTTDTRDNATAVYYNGYVYMIGGDQGSSGLSTIYYTKVNPNGSLQTPWTNQTATGLTARTYATAVAVNGYIYLIGGSTNGTNGSLVVEYAKLSADGSIGTFTATTSLGAIRKEAYAVTYNGYIYVVGGNSSNTGTASAVNTVYYGKVNGDGTISSWTTNSNNLPASRRQLEVAVANGYLYAFGGVDSAGARYDSVYYGKINSDGSVAAFSTQAGVIPANNNGGGAGIVVMNGYVYLYGGTMTATDDEVAWAPLSATGGVGSWTQAAAADKLPAARATFGHFAANGYMYAIGGWTGSTQTNTIYYTSAARLKIGGSLDLVGYGNGNLTEGSNGGMLTAGNTKIVGTLDVQDSSNFWRSVYMGGDLVVNGSLTHKTATNSTTAFQVQSSSSTTPIFDVDTTNGRVGINTAAPTADLSFGGDTARTINLVTRSSNAAGSALSITAGAAGAGATGMAGGQLTLQGGAAAGTTGNANGGNVYLTGGAGVNSGAKGLVVIDTAAVTTTATDATCGATTATSCTINVNTVNNTSAVTIGSTGSSIVISMPDPTITTAGRIFYFTATDNSNDFTLRLNAGGTQIDISMRENTTATLVWNGADWTAAGASSSTDLQAAYNNTLTSAGGAELVLNASGGAADGLTVRNNSTSPIFGGLLEVQTSIGSNLFTVNNNATEYANNGGSESSTYTMWAAAPAGGTVTRYTTAGNNIATGSASAFADTTSTANTGIKNTLTTTLTTNLKYKVSYTVRHTSSTVAFTTLDTIYSSDGTSTTQTCASGSTATYNTWTRIDCTFTATAVGASNAIIIRHSDAVEHDFYVDNLSVTVSADVNHAADGSVDSALGTNWTAYDADGGAGTTTPTRDTSNIYDTSGAVAVATAGPAANLGVRNNMSITPSVSTQYLVTFYGKLASGSFTDITVGFLPAGGSSTPVSAQLCADYNTQTLSTSSWTKITCIFTTPSSGISDPDLVIYQPTSGARTFYIDALSITLNTNNSSNVQIGGGNKGGPTTLFTLDRSYGAPIADNNNAYLGSMYYDMSTGRIQCYEADGWGACGAAPDNYVNLNPEYAGAVLNGTGVGTMTADLCSNDTALSKNSTLCSTGQAKNFYKWTSPQASDQTYSIYVTYQLPTTFNGFSSDDTIQLTARTDSTTNASVTYEMFKSTGSAVTQCGTGATTVVTSANTWQTVGINGNEATGCSFTSSSAGNFIIFKINMMAKNNANAYVSTLSFTTTGR